MIIYTEIDGLGNPLAILTFSTEPDIEALGIPAEHTLILGNPPGNGYKYINDEWILGTPDISTLRISKIAEMTERRTNATLSGLIVANKLLASDSASQTKILLGLAAANANFLPNICGISCPAIPEPSYLTIVNPVNGLK